MAWYDDAGEVTHNPFKKFRRRPQRTQSIGIEEQGQDHITQDSSVAEIDVTVASRSRALYAATRRVCSKLFTLRKPTDSTLSSEEIEIDRPKFTIMSQVRATILGSWLCALLPLIPAGVAVQYTSSSQVTVFVVNFLAIIPSSQLLGTATDELGIYMNESPILLALIIHTLG